MKWLGTSNSQRPTPPSTRRRRPRAARSFERLELREVFAADALPVLMVIADQHDFYYREYSETRLSLEEAGLDVVVAATTTNTSYPHPDTGEADGIGAVTPDLPLANVNSHDYSAIVFVGGWGASMYQYAFNDPNGDGITDNYYAHQPYNGDDSLGDGQIAAQKVIVNNLIGNFLADDKQVAAICHGVTVLAWVRVDGVSPLAGKHVAVPTTVSTPPQFYEGVWRDDGYYSGQYDQVVANGGLAGPISGSIGDPTTVADDVVVDGQIITAENFDSALEFGRVIAAEVLGQQPAPNQAPVVMSDSWTIAENAAAGTIIGQVNAWDADAGQSLTYSILSGNENAAFAIDATSGVISIADPAALDFETTTGFSIVVQVMDNGAPALASSAQITIELTDLPESPIAMVGQDLIVQGTDGADTIYLWSSQSANRVFAWLNGTQQGPFDLPSGGRVVVYGGHGNDQIYATDLWASSTIHGGDGHDLITGGHADDRIDGGNGVDRIFSGVGNDSLRGGDGDDYLYGGEGLDLLLGGSGNDHLEGENGFDMLVGGLGSDLLRGGAGDDLLIGGTTSYDNDSTALEMLMSYWSLPASLDTRIGLLTSSGLQANNTVHDDLAADVLNGGSNHDWCFAGDLDWIYAPEAHDRVS